MIFFQKIKKILVRRIDIDFIINFSIEKFVEEIDFIVELYKKDFDFFMIFEIQN